jgi:hypothetical protein
MGLDMYLTGDKFFKTFDKSYNEVERPIDLDGDSIQTISNDLGYWRKFWTASYLHCRYLCWWR